MAQDGSLDIRLVTRICHLQQALDQALDSLEELRSRVQNQSLLEFQLAETEKFASVQQQAIAQLQNQFEQRSQTQTRTLQDLMLGTEARVQNQQMELERLRVRIQRSQTEIQTYLIRLKQKCQNSTAMPSLLNSSEQHRIDLESEVFVARMLVVSLGSQLEAAWQHIQGLGTLLNQHQTALTQLKHQQQSTHPVRVESDPEGPDPTPESQYQAKKSPLSPIPVTSASEVVVEGEGISQAPVQIRALEAQSQSHGPPDLKSTQLRLAETEAELAEQFKSQTRLKHRCQELAVERDHYKQQTQSLQQQNRELQEQVLQQASQAKEYETAVQYWKDLYIASH